MIEVGIRVTGLDKLIGNLEHAKDFIVTEVQTALEKSVGMAETKSKMLTPKDTGYLRSSIGAVRGGGESTSPGYSFVRGLKAGVGTNVVYAIYVHEGYARHSVGQRKFMEEGARQSQSFIDNEFRSAMERVAQHLTGK